MVVDWFDLSSKLLDPSGYQSTHTDMCSFGMVGTNVMPYLSVHLSVCLSVSVSVCLCVCVLQVVLASLPDLGTGFARDLFASWCSDQKSTVIFTSRTSPGTLARELVEGPAERSIELEVSARVYGGRCLEVVY